MLVGTDPLCGNISTLPSVPLLLHSPPWLRSSPNCHPPSLPAKGLPSVWKLFLLHSSLPEVQVPSLFFCLCFFFFLLPYPVTWGVCCLLGSLRSSASVQYVFCRSCSTCRCISDIYVGSMVISTSYSSAILKVSPKRCFNVSVLFCLWPNTSGTERRMHKFSPGVHLNVHLGPAGSSGHDVQSLRTDPRTGQSQCDTQGPHGLALHIV